MGSLDWQVHMQRTAAVRGTAIVQEVKKALMATDSDKIDRCCVAPGTLHTVHAVHT